MFSLCWFLIITIVSYGQELDCYFTDSLTGLYKLDLGALNQVELEYNDTLFNFSYTICANDLECGTLPKEFVMIAQYQTITDTSTGSEEANCWWLTQWDNNDIKQPQYDPRNKIWSFPTFTGQLCYVKGTVVERETNLYWKCNETVETAEIVTIDESIPCYYNITVESKYACDSTPPPECTWYDRDGGHILDLNMFNDKIITAIDTSEPEYIFGYTPCRNGAKCNGKTTEDVMSKLENVTASECVSYLSVWDNSNENNVYPSYDSLNQVWQFEYKNGEECGEQIPSSFYVYWFCDESIIAPNYVVKKAELVAPCLYELEIASNIACN